MSNYVCKKNGAYYLQPQYDVNVMNSPIDWAEPLIEIIDRYNNKVYRLTPQMIIGMAKKERLGLFDGD